MIISKCSTCVWNNFFQLCFNEDREKSIQCNKYLNIHSEQAAFLVKDYEIASNIALKPLKEAWKRVFDEYTVD